MLPSTALNCVTSLSAQDNSKNLSHNAKKIKNELSSQIYSWDQEFACEIFRTYHQETT